MAEELHLDKNEAVYNRGVCTQSMPVDIQWLSHRGLQQRRIGVLVLEAGLAGGRFFFSLQEERVGEIM
jgi:hypothetical protein